MLRERVRRAILPPAQENIDKLEKVMKDGNYYGAQQMFKSISARYVGAERFSDALDFLQFGACAQLEMEQITCGGELAVLFVDTLVKGNFSYDDDTLEVLTAAKTRVEACTSFLKAALKWSSEFGAHKYGSPELHDMLAEYIFSESPEVDMGKVSFHFVRGKNPKKFTSTVINFMGKCYPGEEDLAIARAVLMYLSLGNLRDANYLMDELKKQVSSKELEFPESELMQFISYLLLTLQRDAIPLFNKLRVVYKLSIEREPTFYELLDEIAEKFYGLRRQNPLQGMFGDIFKMMGGE